MLSRLLHTRRAHATILLGALSLSTAAACSGTASRDGEQATHTRSWDEPPVDSVALFGLGIARACAWLHMTMNVRAGTESNFAQGECRDALRAIHERHLDREDRILLTRFRASGTFKVLQKVMAQAENRTDAQMPAACSETEIGQLRVVARPAIALVSIPMSAGASAQREWLEGMFAESMVVALSSLCDELTDVALDELARVAAAPATEHSLAAARETAEWVVRVMGDSPLPPR